MNSQQPQQPMQPINNNIGGAMPSQQQQQQPLQYFDGRIMGIEIRKEGIGSNHAGTMYSYKVSLQTQAGSVQRFMSSFKLFEGINLGDYASIGYTSSPNPKNQQYPYLTAKFMKQINPQVQYQQQQGQYYQPQNMVPNQVPQQMQQPQSNGINLFNAPPNVPMGAEKLSTEETSIIDRIISLGPEVSETDFRFTVMSPHPDLKWGGVTEARAKYLYGAYINKFQEQNGG